VRRIGALLFVVWLAATASAAAECKVHRGDRVVLYSTTDDPSVLAWDSKTRLREYHAASFDEAQAMLPHAILIAPGTHATVFSCVPGFVESPIFAQPDDAIGVQITNGPQHGLIRWVLGTDVRTKANLHR